MVLLGVSPEIFHEHNYHEELCEETYEANSVETCHLRLLHDGNVGACEDHHNFIDNSDECGYCQLTISNYHVLKLFDDAQLDRAVSLIFIVGERQSQQISDFSSQRTGRGPPLSIA